MTTVLAIDAVEGQVYRIAGLNIKMKIIRNRDEDGQPSLNVIGHSESFREAGMIARTTELEVLPKSEQTMVTAKSEAFKVFKEKMGIKKGKAKIHIFDLKTDAPMCKANPFVVEDLRTPKQFFAEIQDPDIEYCKNCRKFHLSRNGGKI